jgi:4-amino-4-deoxychorismate lyase
VKSRFLETIKAVDGIVYNLEYHQARLEDALKSLGVHHFPSLTQHLSPPSDGLYRCRVLYDEHKLEVSYHKYEKRNIKSLKIVYDDTIDYHYKYEEREALDKLFAQREDCDDVLIVQNFLLKDTTIANIALYDGQKWVTPKNPLLKGTTRARLLKKGLIVEKEILISDLDNYSQLALMNAMIDFDIIASENIRNHIC